MEGCAPKEARMKKMIGEQWSEVRKIFESVPSCTVEQMQEHYD